MTYNRLQVLIAGFKPNRYSQNKDGPVCLAVKTNGEGAFQLLSKIVEQCDDENEAADLVRLARLDPYKDEIVICWPTVTP